MFWTVDFDDFLHDVCGEGRYPLIEAMKSGLGIPQPVTLPTSVDTSTPSPVFSTWSSPSAWSESSTSSLNTPDYTSPSATGKRHVILHAVPC